MSRTGIPAKMNTNGGDNMDKLNGLIQYETRDYGRIRVKLAEVMDERGITRNRLRTLTGVKYDVIDRYYKGENIIMADLDFFAKVCFVLECKIEDILEFEPPEAAG